MNPAERRDFLAAVASLPKQARDWLESGDIELFAYYGWGVVLNSAQLEHLNEVISFPPGTIHVWRWANRTGKTTGLDLLYAWAAWYKWRYENADFNRWLDYRYKVLHAAPLGELAGKAYETFEQLIAGAADQQRDPTTNLQRPAPLAAFYRATKTVDATGVDRPVISLANGAQIDFRSTQGKAARLESDSWWLIGWDEFPRQQPYDDIPVIFDQTFLPRSSDFMAPIVMAGTATKESEYVYLELEEIAARSPGDWNFTRAARSSNFAQSKASIDRQMRLSINREVAQRSVHGEAGLGSGELFPDFLLDNAFREELPEVTPPPADDVAWERFNQWGGFLSSFDHAIANDDNAMLTVETPWPIHRATPLGDEPRFITGAHLGLLRGSRILTPDEQRDFAVREYLRYRSKIMLVDATGEGGLMVYRGVAAAGVPAIDVKLQGRAQTWVTNKEYGIQALQRLLAFGLEIDSTLESGYVEEWPEPKGPFGVLRFPSTGDWAKLKRQLRAMKRDDAKIRQDAAMTLIQLAWYLWRFFAHAQAKGKPVQPFKMTHGARARRGLRGRATLYTAR